MKKNKILSGVLKYILASFLLVFLAIPLFFYTPKAKAETFDLTYYSDKVLFIPPQAISYLNFYVNTESSVSAGVNLGTMYLYARYPYQATIQNTVYTYRKSSTNYNQNGIVYTGGGNFNYLIYQNGNYQVQNYVYDSNYPPLYIVIEFNNFNNLPQNYKDNIRVSTPSDLFSNGCQFLEAGPTDTNDYLYYAFLGGYLSTLDIQTSFENGKQEVINNPSKYNLYTESQLRANFNSGYQSGLAASSSEFTKFSTVLSTVFNGMANILNVEILGKLKIIHLIGVPLLLGLFVIVLKIIRG